jgi:hypothetical protein
MQLVQALLAHHQGKHEFAKYVLEVETKEMGKERKEKEGGRRGRVPQHSVWGGVDLPGTLHSQEEDQETPSTNRQPSGTRSRR